jgi:hypothetical protein
MSKQLYNNVLTMFEPINFGTAADFECFSTLTRLYEFK